MQAARIRDDGGPKTHMAQPAVTLQPAVMAERLIKKKKRHIFTRRMDVGIIEAEHQWMERRRNPYITEDSGITENWMLEKTQPKVELLLIEERRR